LGWVITGDDIGEGPTISQGARTLGTRQKAFDAEVAAIEEAVKWFGSSPYLHLTIHSGSTSAIVRAGHSSAGPGQQLAKRIQSMVAYLPQQYQTAEITCVKATPGRPETRGQTLWLERQQRWLLRFLELSGVGRFVEGGVDEDEAHATRMDDWVVWEAKEERGRTL
jgi:hypothetical protein